VKEVAYRFEITFDAFTWTSWEQRGSARTFPRGAAERDFLRDTPRRGARVFPKLWFPRCSVNTRPRRRAFRALSHASSRRCTGRGIDFNFGSSDFLPLRDNSRAHARMIKANTVTKLSTVNHANCKTAVPRAL